ncbi:MAG: glycosyltransferase [Elusimicrobiota bacterium]|jgi:CDP-glycerol glycerophosphotransferase|nr:glycosyltransferase [Elusimicrobiota bacterium]
MPQNHLISVVIPVYNSEQYLSQCLENLIFQTYKNLEIIIVDDGSTDGSHLVYEKYASQDPRIKIIKQENKGPSPSAASNVGFKQAKGDYIHFIDNDDYLDLDYYEKMLKAAVDTQADMACGGFVFFRDGEGGHWDDMSWGYNTFSHSAILTNIYDKLYINRPAAPLAAWQYLLRTEFVRDKNLSFEEGRMGQDLLFSNMALYYANKVVLVPDVKLHYRFKRLDAISSAFNNELARKRDSDHIYMLNKLKEFARSHNFEYEVDNPDKDYVMSKYKLFSKLSLFRKKVYNDKIKYYILGGKVCVLTVKLSEGKDG